MRITSAEKRDQVSTAITSSNFILFSLFWVHHKNLCPLFFLMYINNLSNDKVSTVKHLAADILFFIAHNGKILADELNWDLKANLNGHPYAI